MTQATKLGSRDFEPHAFGFAKVADEFGKRRWIAKMDCFRSEPSFQGCRVRYVDAPPSSKFHKPFLGEGVEDGGQCLARRA